MAQNGSKTTASTYTNKKGVQRTQVAFDTVKLAKGGKLTPELIAEIEQAIAKA